VTDLIIGAWWRLPAEELEPFLGSLRHTTFDGDVCILVGDASQDVIELLMAHGVIVDRLRRFGAGMTVDRYSRYYGYLDFITRHAHRYGAVLLTDLRDVVFQSNPFDRPLPADIVYTHERCLIGDNPIARPRIAQTYGDDAARNLRDFPLSCCGTTFGTVHGIVRYLLAMTQSLFTLPVPLAFHVDQAIHNHVVHSRALRGAWLNASDDIVASMEHMPDESVAVGTDEVLIDGNRVPVLHQWQKHPRLAAHVRSSPRFRFTAASSVPAARALSGSPLPDAPAQGTVICFYHRERDAGWLEPFVASLRMVGFAGPIHCIGAFDETEKATLSHYRCTPHGLFETDFSIGADNLAHFCFCQLLDELAVTGDHPDRQVMLFESVHAVFQRDPFIGKTIGLSVFCEGSTRIGESEFNLHRVAHLGETSEALRRRPVISSAVLRGDLGVLRDFYRRILKEYAGRAELLRFDKSIQGAMNWVCHGGDVTFPVAVHPNGAEIFFQTSVSDLAITTDHGITVGGAVPAAIFNPFHDTELLRTLRCELGINAGPP
jgi:hypothetical protein